MISKQRLYDRIESLAEIGKTADGGVTRIAFTEEYKKGLDLITSWMEQAGMNVRMDQAGNLIGRLEAGSSNLPAVAIGSHIDSVGNGGKFDGTVGVIAGIEVAQHLYEENISINRPLEVIAFCEEEGSRFQSGGVYGSRAMAGKITADDLAVRDKNGVTRYEVLKQSGLDPDRIQEAVRDRNDIGLYLEMHIEQGPILADKKIPVGIITGITGLSLTEIVFEGESNHVGATPMNMRNDALLGACEAALAVEKIVNHYGGTAVGTAATMDVYPSQVNIVPGKVSTIVDVRDVDVERREKILHDLEKKVQDICKNRGLHYQFITKLKANPAMAATHVFSRMKLESERLNLNTYEMPSGGGHDAQLIAEFTDMGMIFVRSENGSHNPKEYAAPEDIASGTELLSNVAMHYLKG
ncbi:Zn-dependent hydrolase [Shouchella clausii]|nr:Zn-dependent hydrolase [Shouchella clausii]